jgi:putative Mg2+ transporter-C (MgtC) family protein
MDIIFNTASMTNSVVALRLLLSLVAGGIIGLERSNKREYAGLRTHILICLGSTLLMLLSIWIPEQYLGAKNGDPGRIAAQVVSGIGFLGAGSIIRLGNTIKGLTTAASLWFVAALGLAIGAGMYIPCAVALGLALFALVVLDPVERYFFPAERFKHLVIHYSGNSDFPEKARKTIETFGLTVQSVDVERNLKKGDSQVRYFVRIPNELDTGDLYKLLKDIGGVEKVELREKF